METAPTPSTDADTRAPTTPALERASRRAHPQRLPRALGDGRVEVDATWGIVQPMRLAEGVETVGELELIAHLRAGGPLIDTRLAEHVIAGTIPGARAIPHTELATRLDEIDPDRPTVLFCNGPQCPATPDAVRILLAAGRRPATILYYRGGIHDWVTLGFPLSVASPS
ncbi:rhodanese-like domain-containing protein [Conexibacter sp. DBS9H8]|uniref:rhodanese-like domain-containing protein n=1 Tax=Conexibacter sp. DBS9H8 TaxID=2937801 RepID=UPI00200D2F68|nr:rhodanese-like domain-containing protein [Conexibacter sp. DBS9H8]